MAAVTVVRSVGLVAVVVLAALLVHHPRSVTSRWMPHNSASLRRLDAGAATFQGIPVVYHNGPPRYSTTHCIGETFHDAEEATTTTTAATTSRAWLYRSCQYRYMCYDTDQHDFVLFPSPHEQRLAAMLALASSSHRNNYLVTVSSVADPHRPVSLAAVDPPDDDDDTDMDQQQQPAYIDKYRWFPRMVTANNHSTTNNNNYRGYYQLDDSYLMVPFMESQPVSSESIRSKDFLSIFTLAYLFGLDDKQLVLVRHTKHHGIGRDDQDNHDDDYTNITVLKTALQQHLPAMGIQVAHDDDDDALLLRPTLQVHHHHPTSPLVCAKYSAAGLGMLMTPRAPQLVNHHNNNNNNDNHLAGSQQQQQPQWTYTHAVGRDATLRAFQQYTERNEGYNANNMLM